MSVDLHNIQHYSQAPHVYGLAVPQGVVAFVSIANNFRRDVLRGAAQCGHELFFLNKPSQAKVGNFDLEGFWILVHKQHVLRLIRLLVIEATRQWLLPSGLYVQCLGCVSRPRLRSFDGKQPSLHSL